MNALQTGFEIGLFKLRKGGVVSTKLLTHFT
jgi:hypothetical protein